jgi:hypothetical protein
MSAKPIVRPVSAIAGGGRRLSNVTDSARKALVHRKVEIASCYAGEHGL